MKKTPTTNKTTIKIQSILVFLKKAEKLKFRGSPTLLINGNDFEERQIPNSASLNCRIYQNGLPTVEDIRKKY